MLKRIVVAGAFAVGLSSVALADGLPERYAPSYYGAYNWTGFYIGTHIGWERGDVGGNTSMPLGNVLEVYSQGIDGLLGGGQLGANLQIGRAVLGVELSGSWDDISGRSTGTVTIPALTFTPPAPSACLSNGPGQFLGTNTTQFSFSCRARQEWTGQLLARAGYAIGDGRLLPYLTGGIALTELNVRTTVTESVTGFPPPFGDRWGASKLLAGGVLGGGLQYAFGHGVSLGAEYLFTQYAGRDFSSVPSAFPAPNPFQTVNLENHDLSTHTVRFVVNYKFGERDDVPLK